MELLLWPVVISAFFSLAALFIRDLYDIVSKELDKHFEVTTEKTVKSEELSRKKIEDDEIVYESGEEPTIIKDIGNGVGLGPDGDIYKIISGNGK